MEICEQVLLFQNPEIISHKLGHTSQRQTKPEDGHAFI